MAGSFVATMAPAAVYFAEWTIGNLSGLFLILGGSMIFLFAWQLLFHE